MSEHPITPVRRRSRLLPVLVFTIAYVGLFFLAYLKNGNLEFLFYIAILLMAVPILWFVHRRVHLSVGVLWGMSVWGLLHLAGGLVPIPREWPVHGDSYVLYSLWLVPDRIRYDHFIHAYGFGITTWLCWQGLRSVLESNGSRIEPSMGKLTLCIAAGMGFGAFNEVLEFFAVLSLPDTNVGGYINTGWDLVSNLVGCLIAAFIISFGSRHGPAARNPSTDS